MTHRELRIVTPERVDKCSEWIGNQAVAAGLRVEAKTKGLDHGKKDRNLWRLSLAAGND